MDVLALLSPLSLGVVSGLGLILIFKLVVAPFKFILHGVIKKA